MKALLFFASLVILAGCHIHAQTVQNTTPHDSQPVQPVIVSTDPTGSCSNYAQTFINWKTGIQTVCANGSYLSSSAGGGGQVGPQGPAGPTGATGPAGAAATVTVGTTTTGAAGTNAIVTNSGTSNAAVFNFTIPRGADGTGGGAALPFQMTVTSTKLDIGTDCATTACVERIGSLSKTFNTDFVANMPNGATASEIAYVYFDPANQTAPTVGTNTIVLTAPASGPGSGTAFATGITQFPVGSLPLYTVQIVSGAFGAVTDLRSNLSAGNTITGDSCIATAGTANGYSLSLNPACQGTGTFNGGTITQPLLIQTSGTSPLLKILLGSGNTSGTAAMEFDDDLGNGFQVGVPGSANSNAALGKFYIYDKKNSLAVMNVDGSDNLNFSPAQYFNVSSSSTQGTALTICNYSASGHCWYIAAGGTNNDPGRFTFYDATGNSVELKGDSSLHNIMVNNLQVLAAGQTSAPTCDTNHKNTYSATSGGLPEFCDGSAWHTLTYAN